MLKIDWKAIKIKTMAAQHHENPLLSIAIGSSIGIFNYMTNFSFDFTKLIEVIVFGFVGGIAGYLGRIFIKKMFNK